MENIYKEKILLEFENEKIHLAVRESLFSLRKNRVMDKAKEYHVGFKHPSSPLYSFVAGYGNKRAAVNHLKRMLKASRNENLFITTKN